MKLNNISIREAVSSWIKDRKDAETTYGHISNWDTSGVTDMSKLFLNASEFNDPIGSWDVSNVTTMHAMFDNATEFNQPLDTWNTGNVENMAEMFSGTSPTKFNQPIGNWDVSRVTSMDHMFFNAAAFNQNINNWDTSKVQTLRGIFSGAKNFNQPLNGWNTESVTTMQRAFNNAEQFNQELSHWNTSNVTDMSGMFKGAICFNQDIKNWDVSRVKTFHSMFRDAKVFNQPLNNWYTANVETLFRMFSGANKFNQPIGSWDVSKVKDFSWMFSFAHDFNQDINSWDVSNGIDFHCMFHHAQAFNSPINNWNVSRGTNFSFMFDSASSFNQPMSNWKITIPPDKTFNSIIHGFDGFLLKAKNFNQDIDGWIEKYKISSSDEHPFRGVKSTSGKKTTRQRVINIKPAMKKELLNQLSKLIEIYNSSDSFKIVDVDLLLGDDFSEHPAIRDENKVLSFHTSYEYAYENIFCFAINPSCFFTIQMGSDKFTFIYMHVGIDNQWEDDEVFVGITSETNKPSFNTRFMRENVLWFHETKMPDTELKDKIITLGSVLTNEDASWNIFGFFDSDEIPDNLISWASLNDLDW
jgi:surface protein